MKVGKLVESAKSQLADLTGLKPVTVTGAFQDGQGWHIELDMLEMTRIPTSTDVLGDYEVLLDDDGNMVKFDRKRTRLRGDRTETEE
ncbi:MAG: gas vesicle protein [Chloroflexi bacterium]|nr:gas vesicle protein [Chloroflexota bacterium]